MEFLRNVGFFFVGIFILGVGMWMIDLFTGAVDRFWAKATSNERQPESPE